MESNRLHDLQKMESQSFFSESSVWVRVMKCWVPCTIWNLKNEVPLCKNGVQIIFFSPLFLYTFKNIEALFSFLSTGK